MCWQLAAALEEPDEFVQQCVSAFLLADYFCGVVAPAPPIYPPTPPDVLLPVDSTSEMVEALLATLAYVITRPLFSCMPDILAPIRLHSSKLPMV